MVFLYMIKQGRGSDQWKLAEPRRYHQAEGVCLQLAGGYMLF